MSTVQKRLHVSGITPAITADDINARLRGFGKVLDLDGFGTLNAVGEPRKFAYVTLEATESNLSRCLNVLSGTTWKGAKLRIGEAKPDYAQRLENERKRAAEGADGPPSKRRRLPRGVHGVHSENMSTVDTDNLSVHPGWHKTALAHLIRPMKMRPVHPLPEPTNVQKTDAPKKKKRKKPNSLDVPTRARVRVIDPRSFGSVHLRENMLEAVVIDSHATRPKKVAPVPPPSPSAASSRPGTPPTVEAAVVLKSPSLVAIEQESDAVPDFARERVQQLSLLTTMFGDDENEWGSKESVEGEGDGGQRPMTDVVTEAQAPDTIEPEPESKSDTEPMRAVLPGKPKAKSLKDMFQPHEEEAGFSLLAGLGDLELELDLDPAFDFNAPALDSGAVPAVPTAPAAPVEASLRDSGYVLDPTLPLFFPQPDNPRAQDVFALARAEGWEFGRSGDSEAIRNRWDETKGALTREWKKRAREAVKSRRRRYGAAEGEDA